MATRSVASGVALNFGLISSSVSMFSAVESRPKSAANVIVCDVGHEATQVRQPRMCPHCGEVPYQQLKKARPVDGGLVVLTEEDEKVATEISAEFKKRANVLAHPAEQVEVMTGVGEKTYYLVPEKGHETTYATLLALVRAHPETAFMARWTPRSAMGQFRLRAVGKVLVFQERTSGSTLREAPEVELSESPEMVSLAEHILAMPNSITEYDPSTYTDDVTARMAERLKGREIVARPEGAALPTSDVEDLLAKLRAVVAA